jgi:hypothetical protein
MLIKVTVHGASGIRLAAQRLNHGGFFWKKGRYVPLE